MYLGVFYTFVVIDSLQILLIRQQKAWKRLQFAFCGPIEPNITYTYIHILRSRDHFPDDLTTGFVQLWN